MKTSYKIRTNPADIGHAESSLRVGLVLLATALLPCDSVPAEHATPIFAVVDLAARLAPDSPLVADARSLIAVAEDRKTVLIRRFASGAAWEVVQSDALIERVGGLARSGDDLFIADTPTATLLRLNLSTGKSTIVHQGLPFGSPEDLAIVRDQICVADPSAKSVFCLPLAGGQPVAIGLGTESSMSGRTFLASADGDLIVSRPDEGTILEIRHLSSKLPNSALQVQSMSDAAGKRSYGDDSQSFIDTLQSKASVQLLRPAAVSYFHGIVYVVDEQSKQVLAFSRHARRPIRIVGRRNATPNPARIVTSGRQLFVLDGTSGSIETWPMLVPAEIRFESETSEAMADFYEYLYDRSVLPTRVVPLRENLEKTLRDERVLLAPYVLKLDHLLCELNPKLCTKSQVRPILQPGTPIVVPDLYWENYIETRQVALDGSRTLGQEVDRHIQSSELNPWKQEGKLIGMNPQVYHALLEKSSVPKEGTEGIRGLREGTFTIPVERIRYAAALPLEDLAGARSPLAVLQSRFKGFTVISMEENRAQAFVATQSPPVAGQWDQLLQAYERMLKTIHYVHPPAMNMPVTPYIGIAEAEIDCDGPDFSGGACQRLADDSPIPAAVDVPPNPTAFKVRDFEKTDHGTAVASLIAARHTKFNGKGLAAPEAVFIQLHDDDQSLGEDIRKSHLNFNARIYNFSFTFPADKPPEKLRTYVDGNSHDAYADSLFIVAAGNDSKEVTCVPPVYPVCWSTQANVLAVAATVQEGTAFLPESNWGKKFVQVAAPGDGFSVSGRNQSYVPVKGTSFAAPLVTATAALLYAQGVFEPALIKQRIVATSDFKEFGRDRLQGGLLNVRRAVSFPGRSILIDDNGNEKIVQLQPGAKIRVTWAGGDLALPLGNIRRLTRNREGDYRIMYVDSVGKDLLVIERATGFDPRNPWPFKYNELDTSNTVVHANVSGNLTDYADFIGAILH